MHSVDSICSIMQLESASLAMGGKIAGLPEASGIVCQPAIFLVQQQQPKSIFTLLPVERRMGQIKQVPRHHQTRHLPPNLNLKLLLHMVPQLLASLLLSQSM